MAIHSPQGAPEATGARSAEPGADGQICLMVQIETPLGVENADAIARSAVASTLPTGGRTATARPRYPALPALR
jgi:hypothetical protein